MTTRRMSHPLLLAIFPVLFLFAHNIAQVSLQQLWIPLVVAIAVAALLWGLAAAGLRDRQKGGVLASLLMTLLLSHGHLSDAASTLKLANPAWLFGIEGAMVVATGYWLVRRRERLHGMTQALNLIAACLVLVSTGKIVVYEFRTGRLAQSHLLPSEQAGAGSIPAMSATGQSLHPDIYYLIFDRYPNTKVRQEVLGRDNHELTEYLQSHGFYIAEDSRTNYPTTGLSLASSLNLVHLTYLTAKMGRTSTDRTIIARLIRYNFVYTFLKAQGYTLIHLGSRYVTGGNPTAHLNLQYRYALLDEFSSLVLETTMLGGWVTSFRDDQTKRVLHEQANPVAGRSDPHRVGATTDHHHPVG